MTTNIVATITGNGAALTAELNKTFGAIPGMARRVGDQVGDLFGDGIKKGTDELKVAVKASERSIQEIRANIRNTNGAIQFDSSGIKSTIAARQQELQGIEALERALSRKAAKESDATRETQVYLATLRATVDEERQAIAALTSKAQVLDNLQAETGQAAVQQARLNATTGQARAGMQQLGFQISDVSQSFASGVSPMVIFGQQASQVVQAVGMMTNKTSGLIGFLAGPFGAALTAAVTVLGTLYFAHEKAAVAVDNVKFATNKMSDAQSILGNVMDLTTGKINTQNTALIALAQAQILVAQVQAKTRATEARKGVLDIQDRNFELDGSLVGFSVTRRKKDARDAISRDVLAGTLDSKVAIERLENLRKVGKLTDEQFAAAAASVANLGLELQNVKVFEDAGKLLDGTGGRSLLKGSDIKRGASDKLGSDAARDAKQAQDALAGSLKNVISLFNPAAQAAAEYRLQLQDIKNLESAGVGNGGISSADAARYRADLADSHAAKLDGIEDARHAKFMGNMSKEFQLAGDLGGDVAEKMVSDYLETTEAAEAKIVELRQKDVDRQRQEFEDLASFYERAFQSGGQSIWSDFKRLGKQALAELAAQATIKLLGGGSAAGGGGLFSSLGSLFGAGSSAAGAGAGSGALSGAAAAAGPAAAAVALNQATGKALGNDQLKNGMLMTLFLGPVLTKLVGSALKGSATLGFSNGELGVGATSGNSGSRIGAAKSGITAVGDLLNQIAEGVGGTITGAGSVSLGMRKKNYVVDTSGRGRTKGSGVLSFKNEQDAIEAALRDALQDGVISGISAASQKIIASGQDLQKAIQKAVMIESIPKALKARMNPVGAALDELNAKWDTTIAALKEGGASAAQMADAEKLYRLEREDAMKAANDNLKEFINSLNFGGASTYSLMDQSQMARADLDKYLGNINSGNFGAVDQQKYLASAQEFLNIQRELNGSGTGWFNSVDELRNATQKLADGLEKGTADAATRDPFAQETASNTQATAEILAQHSSLLVQQGETLANIAQSLDNMSANGGGFIGSDRRFVGDR